jgi:uncharacterized protein involved in outer membrane biogenesis
MRRFFRWVFRVGLGLLVLAVVGVVVVVLWRDSITKAILAGRLHSATGMEVKISALHIGLRSPTVSIEGFELYNTAHFGGAVCLNVPELRMEYDRSALRAGQIHLTLLRLDLAELLVVTDKNGRRNFDVTKKDDKESSKHTSSPDKWDFIGIDTMNASLGRIHVSDMASGQDRGIDFNVTNQILRDVKDWSDLAPLGLTTLSQGKPTSAGGHNMDLSQLLDSLLKTP